ncbi:putative dehydrogenase [Jimgerdemannia flammicorona]|uniref:Putative dehydrogenase n=2 Tax=Jimgerdemannia flammicorona TaxID=994334 RepID=A0A433QLN4_9FUNG|nr:putative dehydrogenase [Jimgerdemannia flammicorona]RUS30703.1 putative dehydrogenase [Jimgerdemannia flammicorona]
MRAVILAHKGNLANLHVEDIPLPKPSNGQVLVKVAAAAINLSDVRNAQGIFAFTTYPRVPGRDFSGTVIEAGEDCLELVGTAVYGTGGVAGFSVNGSHAEFILVNAKAVRPKPRNLSFVQAAAVGVQYLTAYAAIVDVAQLKEGEAVLIIGARGSVGTSALQIANQCGASTIYGTYSSAPLHPSTHPLHTPIDLSAAELPSFTVNVIIDTVGSPSIMTRVIPHLAQFGRYAFISVNNKETGPGHKLSIDGLDFYRRNLRLLGLNSLSYTDVQAAEVLENLTPGFESGILTPPKDIKEVKLDDAKAAYDEIANGGKTKIVLVP